MFDTKKRSKEIYFDGSMGEATLDSILQYTSNSLNALQSKLDCIECELDDLQPISIPEDVDAEKSWCETYVTNLDTTFAHTLDCTVTNGTIHTQLHKIEPCPHCYGDIDDSGYCKYCGSRVYVWR